MKWLIPGIGLIYLLTVFGFGKWQENITRGGDAWGYYAYLPALFIHHDLATLEQGIRLREQKHPGSTVPDSSGIRRVTEAPALQDRNVLKYTYGVSLLNAPAFGIAHLYASVSDRFPADGYSTPYLLAIYVATILYVLAGLAMLGTLLIRYFPRKTVLAVLALLALGTNLFYFCTINNGMAHPLLFFLWSGLLLLTDTYFRRPRATTFFLLGAICGLITVIRPVEAICLFIPLFWGISSLSEIPQRIRKLSGRISHLAAAVLGGLALLLPQFLYWKFATGFWLYYSYPGEGFDFTHPRIWSGLFGFLNGWLIYTPLMVFALWGLGRMAWKRAANAPLFISLVLVHIYVAYSWWNWYYINGFGSRPMIDIYPILAFPLAFFLHRKRSERKQWIIGTVLAACVVLNLFQTWQQWRGILWSEAANKAYYFQTFGKTNFSERMSVALDSKRFQPASLPPGDSLFIESFDNPAVFPPVPVPPFRGEGAMRIRSVLPDGRLSWRIPYEAFPQTDSNAYLRLRVWVRLERSVSNFYAFDALILGYRRNGNTYGSRRVRLNNKPGNQEEFSIWNGVRREWHELRAYFPLDDRFQAGDELFIRPEHYTDHSEVYIDDLRLELTHW